MIWTGGWGKVAWNEWPHHINTLINASKAEISSGPNNVTKGAAISGKYGIYGVTYKHKTINANYEFKKIVSLSYGWKRWQCKCVSLIVNLIFMSKKVIDPFNSDNFNAAQYSVTGNDHLSHRKIANKPLNETDDQSLQIRALVCLSSYALSCDKLRRPRHRKNLQRLILLIDCFVDD